MLSPALLHPMHMWVFAASYYDRSRPPNMSLNNAISSRRGIVPFLSTTVLLSAQLVSFVQQCRPTATPIDIFRWKLALRLSPLRIRRWSLEQTALRGYALLYYTD